MATNLVRTMRLNHSLCITSYRSPGRYISDKRQARNKQINKLSVKALFDETSGEERKSLKSQYQSLLDYRRSQANRSILIRLAHSPETVVSSLCSFGPIRAAFFFQKIKNYLLVEYEHRESVDKLLKNASYFPEVGQVPVQSRLLYAMHQSSTHNRPLVSHLIQTVKMKSMTYDDFLKSADVNSQMVDFHKVRQLSDTGSRLRFFICTAVEDLVRAILPFCRLDPFGSSSNGFGWEGCDLDMVLTLLSHQRKMDPSAKFRFLTKRGSEDERVFGQQCLDIIGELIRNVMPSAYNVVKVLNARVPIIKFHYEAANIESDLACTNISGAKMSELKYLLGEVDPRVRVLMTTIKQWARVNELTRKHPGPWPSNFNLLAMLVFFLQTRTMPVLPTIKQLQTLSAPEDHFMIDGVDYTFVTNVSKIKKSRNNDSLVTLLKEFFQFYAHFDFSSQGLSLIEGSSFTKTDSSAIYIENPLEISHNIAKNVNSVFVTKMKETMFVALDCLETKCVPRRSEPWGLMCLFQPPSTSVKFKSNNIAYLFSEEMDEDKTTQKISDASDATGPADSDVKDSEPPLNLDTVKRNDRTLVQDTIQKTVPKKTSFSTS